MIMMSRENSSYIHQLSLSLLIFMNSAFKNVHKFSLMLNQEVIFAITSRPKIPYKECLPYIIQYIISRRREIGSINCYQFFKGIQQSAGLVYFPAI